MFPIGLGARIDFATAADAEGMRGLVMGYQPPALGASIAAPSAKPTLGM